MIVAPILILTAFVESPFKPDLPAPQLALQGAPGKHLCAENAKAEGRQPASAASVTEGVADLPFAMGRRFATLDQYLAHLECYAQPVDLPWWKEIEPGVFEHMTTATNAPPREIVTRDALMKRFGFSR